MQAMKQMLNEDRIDPPVPEQPLLRLRAGVFRGDMRLFRYEEDVHIPMFVRVPASARHPASSGGVARAVNAPTLNVDIAPTMLDLAGFSVAAGAEMDGQSILPLLDAAAATDDGEGDGAAASLGRAFLIEYFPIPHAGNDVQVSTKGTDGWCEDADVKRSNCPNLNITVDSVNNTWACVRTLVPPPAHTDTIFCHFYDATGYDISFVRNETNFVEFYNMSAEPWQLRNLVHTLSPSAVEAMAGQLEALMTCKGAEQCADAGTPLALANVA
jgi:hypothetical protein